LIIFLFAPFSKLHLLWIYPVVYFIVMRVQAKRVIDVTFDSGIKEGDTMADTRDFEGDFVDNPESVDYQKLALRAEQLNIRGDHHEVLKLLEPYAKNLNNKNTSFFNELGIAYGKIGSQLQDTTWWHKAYDCHKMSYRLDSEEPIYMFNLALAASWIEDYGQAKELFTKYLESGDERQRELTKNILRNL